MNETEKRRRLALEISSASGMLMDTLYQLNSLRMRAQNLTFVDADFTGVAGLEHVTKARIDTGLATMNTVLTAFAQQNYDDVFEALRS